MKKFVLILFLLLVIFRCESLLEPKEEKEAHFIITSKTTGIKSYGSPYVKITVKNDGDATGYNVSCDVQAKRGNLIVDSGFAYFANGGNIRVGESAQDEAIFFDLNSHNDYDNLVYDLDWLTK